MTVQTALKQGTEILEKEGISAPRLTAEVLLCHAMGCERGYLYAHAPEELTTVAWIHYGRYLNERLKGKPTQYVTKRQEFYGRDFLVTPDVLIPRPETEHLVEAAVAAIKARDHVRILDVGTGSGAIAISVALETAKLVFASDISAPALQVAERNRAKYRAPVGFVLADLASAIDTRSLDLLISNPPYVPGADVSNMQREVRDWEPHLALFAGDTGLEIYERLIRQAELVVRPGGEIMLELGYQALAPVRDMMKAHWRELRTIHDLAGLPRVTTAIRN
ncbi:MAG: peptide chain release factor N(5)-glutamine methyltransferase [Bryobacteraceae bacterium]